MAPWHRAQPVQQPEYCTRTAEKLKLAWPNLRGPDVVDVLLSFRNFRIRSILTHVSPVMECADDEGLITSRNGSKLCSSGAQELESVCQEDVEMKTRPRRAPSNNGW